MKKLSFFLALVLMVSLLAGCAGTPVVYYSDCTCPTGSHDTVVSPTAAPDETQAPVTEGTLKTGLYISTSVGDSKSATEEEEGQAKYDLTMAAVLVDDNGVIQDCIIDGISANQAYINFDTTGSITTDLTTGPATKNELGENYGMVAWGQAIAEWDAQAASFASYVIGKTADEVAGIAVDEAKKPTDADLVSSVTISVGDFITAVQAAVANAQHLGAQAGDTLKLAAATSLTSSTDADAENAGNAQLDVDVTALTLKDSVITSCVIDAVQAKVAFDSTGTVTSDVTAPVQTKNELGANYNMVAWGQAKAEWNEQAASFASYITGKTAAEVAGISVDETTKPTDADLVASVTIKIGGFQALITKACQ